MNTEQAHETLERLKVAWRIVNPGSCKIPSLGDACPCVLCLADKIHALIGPAAPAEKTEERKLLWSTQGKVHDPVLDGGRMCIFADGEYLYPEDALSDAPEGATVRVTIEVIECIHVWRDARNKVVESGELCIRCGKLRAGNSTSEGA